MLFLTLVVFGLKSYEGLSINLMPNISYPTLTVRTEYEGAAPEDVEKLVTRPLEETLSIVGGLVEISSTSSPGTSEIVLEFTWGTDMNVAQQDVRDRLDLYDPPREVTEKPIILRYDPTLDPVLRVAMTGPPAETFGQTREEQEVGYTAFLKEIRLAAERYIKGDMEGEIGIAQVNIKGGREKEIEILVQTGVLTSLGLSLADVRNALAQQNINLSAGSLKEGKTEYLVRTLNEYQEVSEIAETIIGAPEGTPIRLTDIALVQQGEKERDTLVRINGREAVELEIYKDGDANTVEVCRKVSRLLGLPTTPSWIERLVRFANTQAGAAAQEQADRHEEELALTLRSRLGPNADKVTLSVISDQSRFIVASIKEVQNTAVQGGVLALIILYAFLRDMRSTLIIGISIPISVVATFVPMYMRDISLNIMSLGGLALGIGMLVDNSIVVLESIFRCREEGDEPITAADRGVQEVSGAVVASTLTTVAVFLPIAFVEGVAGQLFEDQAMTVTFSLLASLLVALYLIPMIASRGRLAMMSGAGAVWFVRAYRMGREEAGLGRSASLFALPVFGARIVGQWFRETSGYYFSPVRRAWDREQGTVLGRIVSVPGAAFLVCVFAIHVVLYFVLLLLSSILFGAIFFFGGIVFAAWKLLKLVLWAPLGLFDLGYSGLRRTYEIFLRSVLRFGPVLVLAVAAVAYHAFTVAQDLGQELIPPMKQGEFGIRMEAAPGTRLDETANQAARLESILLANEYVETVTVQVGQEQSKVSGDQGENVAQFNVILRNPEETTAIQDQIIEDLRAQMAMVSANEIAFTLPKLFSFKEAIEIQIRGESTERLRTIGEEALALIADVDGLRDAELSIKDGYPEVTINFHRDRLWEYGLTVDEVAQRIRGEVQGEVPTRFDESGFKVDMRVRTAKERLNTVADVKNLSIRDGDPPIPLTSVADVFEAPGPSEIRRIDQRQVAMLTGNIEGRDLAAVTQDITARLRGLDLPEDYEVIAGGQNRELETSYNSLVFALILAVFLVYVVMACQFESILHPALVMFSVPLAFVGVIYSLWAMEIDLSIVVFIGGITLAGIVVNNAIVLVDYINHLRRRGVPKREAVVQAGLVRLRPILMTTLTTVLGLIPMAFYAGEGAEIRQPMAVTIIAGLTVSTFLTLVIIPTAYDLFAERDKTA